MEDPLNIMKINTWIKLYIGVICFSFVEDLIALGLGRSSLPLILIVPITLLMAGIFAYYLSRK